jgi:hypothetical protein
MAVQTPVKRIRPVPLWCRLLNCGFRQPATAARDRAAARAKKAAPSWGPERRIADFLIEHAAANFIQLYE